MKAVVSREQKKESWKADSGQRTAERATVTRRLRKPRPNVLWVERLEGYNKMISVSFSWSGKELGTTSASVT